MPCRICHFCVWVEALVSGWRLSCKNAGPPFVNAPIIWQCAGQPQAGNAPQQPLYDARGNLVSDDAKYLLCSLQTDSSLFRQSTSGVCALSSRTLAPFQHLISAVLVDESASGIHACLSNVLMYPLPLAADFAAATAGSAASANAAAKWWARQRLCPRRCTAMGRRGHATPAAAAASAAAAAAANASAAAAAAVATRVAAEPAAAADAAAPGGAHLW